MSIYVKLASIQEKLEVPKKHFNKFGNYPYRNCEDILDALKPLLKENKCVLFINDDLVLIGDRYYVKATVTLFDLEDNSQIVNTSFAREEESKKGMDGSQVSGAAGSYARKYALNGMFMIDDVKDSDTTNQWDKPDNQGNKPDNKPDKPQLITEAQIKRAYAIAYGKNKKKEDVDKWVSTTFKKPLKELSKQEYDKLCSALEQAS